MNTVLLVCRRLLTVPDQFGRLRGSDLLVDGRAAREARNIATTVLTELMPLVRAK
ncbi:hypothetical protein [Rhizobium tropici]|uniref:hypothetical protein n=1 Tax=Rhizobium tropici TaxID=398 RepID=UPI0015EBC878|nr:hypothetical protein [Rhizobium tropici]